MSQNENKVAQAPETTPQVIISPAELEEGRRLAPIVTPLPSLKGVDYRTESRTPGIVKWYNAKLGYGFIVRDNGENVFVTHRSISMKNPLHTKRSLGDGEPVVFNTMAVDVTGIGGKPVKGDPVAAFVRVPRIQVGNDGSGDWRSIEGREPSVHWRNVETREPRIDWRSTEIREPKVDWKTQPRWSPIYRSGEGESERK